MLPFRENREDLVLQSDHTLGLFPPLPLDWTELLSRNAPGVGPDVVHRDCERLPRILRVELSEDQPVVRDLSDANPPPPARQVFAGEDRPGFPLEVVPVDAQSGLVRGNHRQLLRPTSALALSLAREEERLDVRLRGRGEESLGLQGGQLAPSHLLKQFLTLCQGLQQFKVRFEIFLNF